MGRDDRGTSALLPAAERGIHWQPSYEHPRKLRRRSSRNCQHRLRPCALRRLAVCVPVRAYLSDMCNLYSVTKGQRAIRDLFAVKHGRTDEALRIVAKREKSDAGVTELVARGVLWRVSVRVE